MTVALDAQRVSVDDVVDGLEADGYAVVHGVLDPARVQAVHAELDELLETIPYGRNAFEGFKTRRIYALFAKTRAFDEPATHPLVLGVLDRVLGHYQLSGPTGIQIGPGEPAQVVHRDEAIYPLTEPHPEVVLNTMWAFDDFTEENGATYIIPGSHRWVGRDFDASAPSVNAVMPAGSVLFYSGRVWHGGGANRSDRPRLGVVLEYAVTWLRAQENHLLAVPPDVVRTLPERLQELLGYNVHPPFIGYVDGRHPRHVL
jgi:ectoine hydroxylase-related dioxygenase (phytanoyl-CoA dioxygenase family)